MHHRSAHEGSQPALLTSHGAVSWDGLVRCRVIVDLRESARVAADEVVLYLSRHLGSVAGVLQFLEQ